jgi:hypothetical protein
MSSVLEKEEELEEKERRIDVNKFYEDLKRSDSWESTEELHEGDHLKGQCHEIFDPRFFSSIDHP